jgi:hypothetical protein
MLSDSMHFWSIRGCLDGEHEMVNHSQTMKEPSSFGIRTEKERRSFDSRLNVAEIKHASLLINTADYCQVTALEVCLAHIAFSGSE